MAYLIGSGAKQVSTNQMLGDLAFMSKESIVLKPKSGSVPASIGTMVFERIDDNSVRVKYKGLDGTVRFAELLTGLGGTKAVGLPPGTTAERPSNPVSGMIRYNTDTISFEGYSGGTWTSVGGGATGAVQNPVFYENDTNVTGNYTITAGKNAMSAGPITINAGVAVTVPDGSVWTVV